MFWQRPDLGIGDGDAWRNYAGNAVVVCIEPRGGSSRAARWLHKHPDGVGTLNFEVELLLAELQRGSRQAQ